jgi:hypothetical protein
MHAMPDDEVERPPVNLRRQEMEQKLTVLETKARALAHRHGRLAAGLAITAVAAFGLGMLVSRRRQRNSVMGRMHRAIPDSVWDLPEELVAQLKKARIHRAIPDSVWDLPEELVAQLKKPLRRATKAL